MSDRPEPAPGQIWRHIIHQTEFILLSYVSQPPESYWNIETISGKWKNEIFSGTSLSDAYWNRISRHYYFIEFVPVKYPTRFTLIMQDLNAVNR